MIGIPELRDDACQGLVRKEGGTDELLQAEIVPPRFMLKPQHPVPHNVTLLERLGL